ncbi:Protein NPHP-4 [Aphelenchoides avenae]|nr:Protein NPHP-4 [Aphelenchus avenae]
MGSPARWYERFLANLSVPLEDNADRVQVGETVPYAFRVASAEFRELDAAAAFSVHVFFYDTKSRQFFGRQWNGRQKRPSNHYLTFDETLFFHTSVAEDRIVLVCEVVKLDNEPWVYAWSVVPVFVQSQAITDYSTSSVPPPSKRFQLYRGSCKNLLYLNSLAEMEHKLIKSDGVLVCCLQTHQRMNAVVGFFPEFYLASREEHIPGIRRAPEGESSITSPQTADTFTAVIDNIAISFGASPNQVEESVLSLLNREYCYRLNKSPKDLNVPKLAIIERRLRVGVHNSLTYVDEPICLDRAPYRGQAPHEVASGKPTELADFIARNSVKLTRLCADPTLAIVFAMDYLEITAESELVTVCWNAWSPYHDGSFSVADTVTVPLVGGPRPNPDGVLCFKNLLWIYGDANPFADGRPHLNLKFNFAIVSATHLAGTQLRCPGRTLLFMNWRIRQEKSHD